MDKSFTEAQERHLRHCISSLRVSIVLVIMTTVMLVIWIYGATAEQTVYACNDVDTNPPDVVKQCKHLTKYQWWGTYYTGVRK